MCYNPDVHNRIPPVLFFILCIAGNLVQLSAQVNSGFEVRYPTGGRITAAVYNGVIKNLHVLSADRYLYALDREGTFLHRTWLNNRPTASLSEGYDRTLYCGFESGSLKAINPYGMIIWERRINGVPVGNPVPDPDGTLYTATDRGKLYSISHTGVIRWMIELPALPVIAPAVNNHGIFIFGNNSRVYLYSRQGVLKWEFLLSGNALSCALDSDALYVGTASGTVAGIDMMGSKLWSTVLGSPVYSLIMNSAESLVSVAGATLFSIGLDGKVQWKSDGKIPLYSVAADENLLCVSTVSGGIRFHDFKGNITGETVRGKPSIPVVPLNNGLFVSGSRDWNVYFERGENSIVFPKTWNGWKGENGDSRGRRIVPDLKKRSSWDTIVDTSNSYGYLKMMSDSNDSIILRQVLQEIEERLSDEKFDRGKSFFLPLLEYIASYCITRPDYRNGELINDFPVIRADADRILGIYGDFRSREVLISILFSEWDDYGIKVIVDSLGKLGDTLHGDSQAALYRYYQLHGSRYGGEDVRLVMVNALESLEKYNGTLSKDGIHLALEILRDSSRTTTKEKVLDLLKTIKK